ncbi:antiviral reverse transcriptase Drt3b [Campylobacter cuniculorum]|uniref:antiviral reverse transcriptase Drt3b n=1 Tax=Campylobacter cuniculorum TaxID=374106 RepID=UPI0023F080C6|nr:antiviral reverse transcriptase Drt3b [Campylobacter cuniculorum]
MKNKREKIKYKKERVVLSEILPYETPLIFSNKNFYNFLSKYKEQINEYFKNESNSNENNGCLNEIFKILFADKDSRTIPFYFKIPHKTNEYRKLSIMHPINQIKVTDFYDEFKQAILYFSNQSEFSIRKPYKVADLFYNKNNFTKKNLEYNELNNNIETIDHKEKYFKTFFAYKKYSNIYMFYESYEYQRNEKLFNKLYKFDLSKCFDSIYTHSITWAIYSKKIIKDNLKIKNTFAHKFDKLMQNMNYAETHGILIGSELSRIFAEIILQKIDKIVLNKLLRDNKLFHKKDYVIFRYVDDYFLFYNEDSVKNSILQTFNNELQKYKLYLNESKAEEMTKPFVTNITIFKNKIKGLLNNFNLNNDNMKYLIKSKNMIIFFKTIVKESEVKYKDILNYTLAIVNKKVVSILNNFREKMNSSSAERNKIESNIFYQLREILKFIFFIYSESEKISAAVKLSYILANLIKFINSNIFNEYLKNKFYKTIFDEIYHSFKKNSSKKYIQNENLYLLINLKEIKNYIKLNNDDLKELFLNEKMNYFEIVVLLYYIENNPEYNKIKEFIKKIIKEMPNKDTESALLSMDILTCPFLDKRFKKEILSKYNIDENTQEQLIHFSLNQKSWFIQWKNIDIIKELEEKIAYKVY